MRGAQRTLWTTTLGNGSTSKTTSPGRPRRRLTPEARTPLVWRREIPLLQLRLSTLEGAPDAPRMHAGSL